MKKFLVFGALLIVSAAHASAVRTMSAEVAICRGTLGGEKKEITVFRSFDKSDASILFQSLKKPVVAYQNLLFTNATVKRSGNVLAVNHPKINLEIDLASEATDKTIKGKWDNEVDLACKIVTPMID